MKQYWLPTGVEDICNCLNLKCSGVLKRNIAYNIQYLQYLDRDISKNKTTIVLYKIRYKIFIVICISVLEAVFIALLDERNLIPLDEWTEGKHKHNNIDENTIEVTYTKKKSKKTKKASISLDRTINIIKKNNILKLNAYAYEYIKDLQNLRNKLHLEKANYYNDSDYNQFNETEYILAKAVFFHIMSNDIISNNTDYLYFCKK